MPLHMQGANTTKRQNTSHKKFILSILLFGIVISYLLLDIPLMVSVQQLNGGILHRLAHAVTDLGKAEFQLIPAFIMYLMHRKKNPLLANIALSVFAAVAFAGLSTDIIKVVMGRYRPIEYLEHGVSGFSFFEFAYAKTSFPSGHATTVMAAAYMLSRHFRKTSLLLLLGGAMLASTRVLTGHHYPSDVLAGSMLGCAIAAWLYRMNSGLYFYNIMQQIRLSELLSGPRDVRNSGVSAHSGHPESSSGAPAVVVAPQQSRVIAS